MKRSQRKLNRAIIGLNSIRELKRNGEGLACGVVNGKWRGYHSKSRGAYDKYYKKSEEESKSERRRRLRKHRKHRKHLKNKHRKYRKHLKDKHRKRRH